MPPLPWSTRHRSIRQDVFWYKLEQDRGLVPLRGSDRHAQLSAGKGHMGTPHLHFIKEPPQTNVWAVLMLQVGVGSTLLITPQKSLFVDPCSSLEPPTHPRGDAHCLVPQTRKQGWTNSLDGCCSQGKLHPGWSGGTAWNAFGFFFFFIPLFSSLYVTNAKEEETVRKYSLKTQCSHRTTSGCQTTSSWGWGGSCQQPIDQSGVQGLQLPPQPLGGQHLHGPARSTMYPFSWRTAKSWKGGRKEPQK